METQDTDGYLRMIRSANYYNIEVKEQKMEYFPTDFQFDFILDIQVETLGIGLNWTGFGTKVNLLREALEPYKDDDQKIILYVDG